MEHPATLYKHGVSLLYRLISRVNLEMTDPRREYRVGCYIFSLDNIPRYVENRAAEQWAHYVKNRIPISRGLAQNIDDWGIPFPTMVPHPYSQTLLHLREPAT